MFFFIVSLFVQGVSGPVGRGRPIFLLVACGLRVQGVSGPVGFCLVLVLLDCAVGRSDTLMVLVDVVPGLLVCFEPSWKVPPAIDRGVDFGFGRRGGAAGRPLMGLSGSNATMQRMREVKVRTMWSFMMKMGNCKQVSTEN